MTDPFPRMRLWPADARRRCVDDEDLSGLRHVDSDDVHGVDPADLGGDERTRVVADRPITLVAEAAHELRPRATPE